MSSSSVNTTAVFNNKGNVNFHGNSAFNNGTLASPTETSVDDDVVAAVVLGRQGALLGAGPGDGRCARVRGAAGAHGVRRPRAHRAAIASITAGGRARGRPPPVAGAAVAPGE